MTLTRLLTAAGFAAVLAAGSTAYAQTSDTTVSVDEQGNTTTTTTTTTPAVIDPATGMPVNTAAPAAAAGVPASSLTTTTAGEPGTVTTRTVTNGPIPDTPENRAKYGQPLSRTGRATTPAGN